MSCGESDKPPGAKNVGGTSGVGGEGGQDTGGASGSNATGGRAGSSGRGGSAGTRATGGNGASDGGGSGDGGTGGDDGGSAGDGGRSGSGGEGGDGTGETRAFLDRLWGAYCKQVMTCAIGDDDVIAQRVYFGTETGCLELLRELLGEEPPTYDLLAGVEAGTIRLVPEQEEACLAEAADCMWKGYFSNGPACRAVFEGTVPVGGACRRWEECAGAAYCDHTAGCPGRCALLGEPGAPCGGNDQCNPGDGYAVCDYEANDTCRRLSIRPRAALNEPCTASPHEATELVVCQGGLWCDPGDGSSPNGICRPPVAEGEACDAADDLCAGNATCFDEMRCEPVVIVQNAGGACDSATGVYCNALRGLTCVEGLCERFGDGTVGSACQDSDFYQRVTCNHGLYCAPTAPYYPEGTCQPLLDADAPCETNDECASGTCTGTCAESYCDG